MGTVRKTIFIGVGGSGGTTLRHVYQELSNGLRERGWKGDLPECWQFLLVDVAQRPDGISGSVPSVLTGEADFFGMAKAPADWDNFLRMLPQTKVDSVAGWMPVSPLPGSPDLGAGQFRALGRLVAVTQLAELRARIGSMQRKIGLADDALQEVAAKLGGEPQIGKDGSPHVWLVSSFGGGSGSGMFLDVSQTLLSMGLEHSTVLYTPDVFDEHGQSGGNRGVTPNSMAAISELISAFESNGPWSNADSGLLEAAGIPPVATDRRTGRSHLLIGRKAAGWEFASQSQVYHATARTIASTTLNHQVNEVIGNYVFQNSTNVARRGEYQTLLPPQNAQGNHDELAQSIGYAAVATGRHAFGMYTAERLVSLIVDKVLDDDDGIKNLRERHPEDFSRSAQNFALGANLFELGKSNQILDAIRGGEVSVITDFTQAAIGQVKDLLGRLNFREIDGPEVEKQLTTNFKGVRDEQTKDFAANLARRAEQWTLEAQSNLLGKVVESVTSDGLGMTIAFLEQMVLDLNASAVELTSASAQWRDAAGKAANTLLGGLQNLGNRVRLALDSPQVTDGLNSKRKEMAADLENRVNATSSEMITDFVKGVVQPLIVTLKSERSRFRNEMQSDAMKVRRESLSSGSVPVHLQPSSNEFYLDETSTFAATFDWILGENVFNAAPGVAVQSAASEVLAGKWEGRPEESGPNEAIARQFAAFANQGLIKVVTPWVSGVFGISTTAHPTPASYALTLNFDALYETAMRWQQERIGVAKFTQVTLGDMINDESHPEIMESFINKFGLALAKAGCMIQIDANALQEFTGNPAMDVEKALIVTPIPVEANATDLSSNARRIADHLMRFGNMAESKAISCMGGKGGSRVEIITVNKERAPAMVYKSISDPIVERMAMVEANPALRKNFYSLRRARGLASFVPVAPQVLVHMVKGWTIARFLGYVPPADVAAFMADAGRGVGLGEIRIFDPAAPMAKGQYWSFPPLALRGTNPGEKFEDTEVLPALLEAMILGYATINSGGLRSYARLAALGDISNSELANWILTGKVVAPDSTSPSVGVVEAWANLATPSERKDIVLENLRKRTERAAELFKITYNLESVPTATRYWELREVFKAAFADLTSDISGLALGGGVDDGPGN